MHASATSTAAIHSAARVLLAALLILRLCHVTGDALPDESTRKIIKAPWDPPPERFPKLASV